MNQTKYNQTQFSLEEPFFQNSEPVQPKMPENPQPVPVAPQSNMKRNLIAGGVLFFVFFLFLVVLLLGRGKGTIELPLPSSAPNQPGEVTELQLQVENYQESLEGIDPTKQTLVFPPVNMKLRLEEKK